MSLSKVAATLSMALCASATGVVLLPGGAGNPCEEWVEQPTECAKQPGCMVKDSWDCVPVEEPASGIVWLQHPPIKGKNGLPDFTPPDTKVPGVPVNGERGGPHFDLGEGVFVNGIPEFLRRTSFHAVPAVEKHGGLKFECPEREVKGFCDFFVAVMTCAPCSDKINGGLPQILTVTNGWEARSCAPVLMSVEDDDKDEYKMTIFRVRVEDGHFVESPRLPRTAHFVAVFSSLEELELCPIPVARPQGPFPAGKKCSEKKCPFHFDDE